MPDYRKAWLNDQELIRDLEAERDHCRNALADIDALITPYEVTTDTELERKIRAILRAARS